MKPLAIFLILLYQRLLSPMLGEVCRFSPSCSQYAKEAVLKYGFLRGIGLAAGRVIRCNPWNLGGFDPLR
jgi:uncharacterized protein